jgi:molybdenum cofactor biosynthesis enzyme MoaA
MIDDSVVPDGALLQVNRYCNLACSHCSQSAPSFQRAANVMELSTDEWRAILRRLADMGLGRVRFTGGEPFIRGDIEELVRAAMDFGLAVSFVTNGIAITNRHLEWIREVRPAAFWISVYGYPESVYERIAGKRGVFARLMRVIETLLSIPVEVGIYYSLGNQSADGVDTFIRDMCDMGVCRIKIIQVLPHGRAAEAGGLEPIPESIFIATLDRIVQAASSRPRLQLKISMDSGQTSAFSDKGFRVPPVRTCQVGLEKLWTLDTHGSALPCCLYLGKTKSGLLDATMDETFTKWRDWDHETTLTKLGFSPRSLNSCPALPQGAGHHSTDDFVCPLTYAEWPIE